MHRVDSPSRETDRPRLPRVELEILRGRARQKVRPVTVPVFLIGSASDCDLVLSDPAFPDVHTYLYVNRGGVSVRRLGEGPELAIDGREVQASPVENGQTLRLGTYEFAVRIEAAISTDDDENFPSCQPAIAPTPLFEPAGVVLVRALLADIRSVLRVEANLKLYAEPQSPWQAITAGDPLLVRKASA